jgi:2-methylcitrate dehydratase PrpD
MPEDARQAPPAVTAEAAGFVAALRLEAIPPSAIARGKVHMLDALGLALAGARAESAAICRDHVAALGCTGPASVLGTAMRTAPRFAAFINGTAMHADNFDDTSPQESPQRNGGIHATAIVLPAALAVAEAQGLGGRALTEAFHAGMELACKLNFAIDQRHYMSGWHVTSTLGVFGAAAAAAKLHGMNDAGIARALAGAASRAAGLRANFGTMVEQTHSGAAAESGIVAADLAGRGLTGATDILEAEGGWFDAAGGVEPAVFRGRLGNPWVFDSPGMTIKPWPSGGMIHPAMTLLQELARRHRVDPAAVARLIVRPNAKIAAVLRHSRPSNGLQAKFSLPFCLAALLIDGRVGIDSFTDRMVARTDIQAMMARVEIEPYAKVEPGYSNLTTLLDIHLADATVLNGRADTALGGLDAPMSYADVTDKFLGCAAHAGWPEDRAKAAAAVVAEIESLADIRALTALLTAG